MEIDEDALLPPGEYLLLRPSGNTAGRAVHTEPRELDAGELPNLDLSRPQSLAAPTLPDDLRRLMELARSALARENSELEAAFASGNAEFYGKCAHGLSYWVFEQNLVYLIFKTWIPHSLVEWESPYPHSSEKADLVIFSKPHEPRFVFEAKWWNSMKRVIDFCGSRLTPCYFGSFPATWRDYRGDGKTHANGYFAMCLLRDEGD